MSKTLIKLLKSSWLRTKHNIRPGVFLSTIVENIKFRLVSLTPLKLFGIEIKRFISL